jgi:hypothetical protein
LRNVAADFGVGISTVSDWVKSKSKLEWHSSEMPNRETLQPKNVVKKVQTKISDFFSYKFVVLYCICKYHTLSCATNFINIRRASEKKFYFHCTLSRQAEFPNYPKYCLSEIGSAPFISHNRGSTVLQYYSNERISILLWLSP